MRISTLVVFSVLAVAACGGAPSSPATPTPNPTGTLTSLSGTWIGTSADTSGQDKMTWTLTQNTNAMTGTMNISDTARSMIGNGSMQGTISGSTMTFHMTVPSGGFDGVMSSCTMGVDGQATMSSDGHTMTGTYSGSMSGMMSGGMMGQSCGGAMNNGQFTLTR
jgi:type V secretory pathway adhesin AidA